MLRIVDATSRRGEPVTSTSKEFVAFPKDAVILLEGEQELLVQLIRDEKLELEKIQRATLYIYTITDRNRSSLGYFGAVEFLETTLLR